VLGQGKQGCSCLVGSFGSHLPSDKLANHVKPASTAVGISRLRTITIAVRPFGRSDGSVWKDSRCEPSCGIAHKIPHRPDLPCLLQRAFASQLRIVLRTTRLGFDASGHRSFYDNDQPVSSNAVRWWLDP
jgi:hypothetical protein